MTIRSYLEQYVEDASTSLIPKLKFKRPPQLVPVVQRISIIEDLLISLESAPQSRGHLAPETTQLLLLLGIVYQALPKSARDAEINELLFENTKLSFTLSSSKDFRNSYENAETLQKHCIDLFQFMGGGNQNFHQLPQFKKELCRFVFYWLLKLLNKPFLAELFLNEAPLFFISFFYNYVIEQAPPDGKNLYSGYCKQLMKKLMETPFEKVS